jgi:N-methylhydantoinase A/oxoprolinase/acetone carboxylase beta subunit
VLTVDIDVGGTLTDGIFTRGEEVICVKVDTTAHDLTVCLFDCLSQGADKLGYADADLLLNSVDLIRWSTTITSNVLAEQRGPRLGLIVSRGHESDLYGDDKRSVLLDRLISPANIIGMDASTPDSEVMTAVRGLLETGVRRICVSFKDANRDPTVEIRVKRVIDQQYPDHFLGSVPVLAGSDIAPGSNDMTRTCCSLINAYTHGALAAALFRAEDELRETHKYTGTFLISHINGGVSGIAKTKAIDTMESGPILGIHGSSYVAKVLGIQDVVALDVGGTTAKVGVLEKGEPIFRKPSDLFGIPVGLSLPYLRSVALGGGSYVKPANSSPSPSVTLGPESMGSYPGPACYGLGGDQATLTDAFVAGGLINPEYFLGGAKNIDRSLACSTIEEQIAKPLGLSLQDACRNVIQSAFQIIADVITNAGSELHKTLGSHTLFAYGGNGGLFACGAAERVGLREVYFFNFGPVFSAFGSSVSDISHVYERPLYLEKLDEAGMQMIRRAIEEMKKEGRKDLLGEGIRPEGVTYTPELEFSAAGRNLQSVVLPDSSLGSAKELLALLSSQMGEALGFSIDVARVQLRKSMGKHTFIKRPLQQADASHARKGSRSVAWGSANGEAMLYDWEALRPGNRLEGCAILEGVSSTYFVPAGWAMEMDAYGNGILKKA